MEMTWTLKTAVPDETVVEYELILDKTRGSGDATIACMYRSGRFPPAVLQQVIRSHSKVIAGDYIYLNLSALFQELTRTDLERSNIPAFLIRPFAAKPSRDTRGGRWGRPAVRAWISDGCGPHLGTSGASPQGFTGMIRHCWTICQVSSPSCLSADYVDGNWPSSIPQTA